MTRPLAAMFALPRRRERSRSSGHGRGWEPSNRIAESPAGFFAAALAVIREWESTISVTAGSPTGEGCAVLTPARCTVRARPSYGPSFEAVSIGSTLSGRDMKGIKPTDLDETSERPELLIVCLARSREGPGPRAPRAALRRCDLFGGIADGRPLDK